MVGFLHFLELLLNPLDLVLKDLSGFSFFLHIDLVEQTEQISHRHRASFLLEQLKQQLPDSIHPMDYSVGMSNLSFGSFVAIVAGFDDFSERPVLS